MRVCVSLCPPPGLLKTIHVKGSLNISPTAFQFLCTALTIDNVDGRDLSNVARRIRRAR